MPESPRRGQGAFGTPVVPASQLSRSCILLTAPPPAEQEVPRQLLECVYLVAGSGFDSRAQTYAFFIDLRRTSKKYTAVSRKRSRASKQNSKFDESRRRKNVVGGES